MTLFEKFWRFLNKVSCRWFSLKAKPLKLLIFGSLFSAMALAVYVGGAAFLTIQDTPVQADAVVLFIGPDIAERFREAHQLIMDGVAGALLIPALGSMWTSQDGKWNKVVPSFSPEQGSHRFAAGQYPGFYENTHIEVLTALRMMADAGVSNAVFVSSPTHMRRIRIITKHVLPDTAGYQIVFRATRYISLNNAFSLFHPAKAKQVVLEYIKIAWFGLYHIFEKRVLHHAAGFQEQ
jgi:hypothetical protein